MLARRLLKILQSPGMRAEEDGGYNVYRSVKLKTAKSNALRLYAMAFLIGLMVTCYSVSVLAESVESLGTKDVEITLITVLDSQYEDVQTETMTDESLSLIEGKGDVAVKLDANPSVTVILWDERGNTDRRNTLSESIGNQNYQSTDLILNHR